MSCADLRAGGTFSDPSYRVVCNGTFDFLLPHDLPSPWQATLLPLSSPCIGYRVGVPELAAAVSNGGGLGILTALTQPNPAALREAIHKTRKLTDKNFGVNITLLPSINPPDYEGYAKAAIEEGITIFETAGNNREFSFHSVFPLRSNGMLIYGIAGPLIKYFKQMGCIVIHKCKHQPCIYASPIGAHGRSGCVD